MWVGPKYSRSLSSRALPPHVKWGKCVWGVGLTVPSTPRAASSIGNGHQGEVTQLTSTEGRRRGGHFRHCPNSSQYNTSCRRHFSEISDITKKLKRGQERTSLFGWSFQRVPYPPPPHLWLHTDRAEAMTLRFSYLGPNQISRQGSLSH